MSKKQTKRDIQAEQTYHKLLDMSLELVKRHGYHKVTISQICDACGCAKGTFYNYFDSKTDILYRLAIQLNEKLSTMFSYDETKSAKELYLQYVYSYMELVKEDGYAFSKNYLQMLISESMSGEKVGLNIQKEYLFYLLDRGRNSGEFTKNIDNKEFFNLWQATVLGVLAMWAIEDNNYDVTKEGCNALSHIIKTMI
ncbi:transcriptional regulator, TetR family [Alkaliphilus metalliredigens QYMF]|uniref:Transcriptional regulator, TetR family n=1 Tax=Alkaliphilus metalliredigens (strain QYMF) TaxID=293826 RepID=A6TUV5_ALKMQ|nr:TetR/AcrR family transcriptional regulator [Alkaliphilus metalliredigens]ABR49973.1 transcriptional regulator, TetR family [Alkaliphilus metalliredigens QYMF]